MTERVIGGEGERREGLGEGRAWSASYSSAEGTAPKLCVEGGREGGWEICEEGGREGGREGEERR